MSLHSRPRPSGLKLILGAFLLAVVARIFLSVGESSYWRGLLEIRGLPAFLLLALGVGTVAIAAATIGRNWVHPAAAPLLGMIAAIFLAGSIAGYQRVQVTLVLAIGAGIISLPVALGASWKSYLRWTTLASFGVLASYAALRLRFNWAWEWPLACWTVALFALGLIALVLIRQWRRGRRLQWSRWRNRLNTAWLLALAVAGFWIGHLVDYEQRYHALAPVANFTQVKPGTWFAWLHARQIENVVLWPENDPKILRELRYFPPIQHLGLHGPQITNEILHDFETWSELEYFGLHETAVTDAGLKQLPPLRSLADIQLHGNPITDDALSILENSPRLSSIHISQTPIHGRSLPGLIRRLQQMKGAPPFWLYLADTRVDDAFVKDLEGLRLSSHLDLSRTHVTAASLPSIIKINGVEWVMLSGLELTAEDFQDLDISDRLSVDTSLSGTVSLSEALADPMYQLMIRGQLHVVVDPGLFTAEARQDIKQRTGIRIETYESLR